MSQTFCGSKAYAAPEILQGRTYDPLKADVWALGVIMYIFITGKMPFDETKVDTFTAFRCLYTLAMLNRARSCIFFPAKFRLYR